MKNPGTMQIEAESAVPAPATSVPAREAAAAVVKPPRRVRFDLATPADEPALRELLRFNPMPGAISLSFQTEPNFFRAATIEGPFQQTMIGRDTVTGAVCGMGSRAVRPLYVNGQVMPVGYFSQLRVDRRREWGMGLARLVAQGFAFLRALHGDGRTPFYLLSVVEDNHAAHRVLTAGLPGMPQLGEVARLVTYAIAPRRQMAPSAPPPGVRLARGRPDDIPALLECLAAYGRRHQFVPAWNAATLFAPSLAPGLRPEHFWLAWRGGQVVGCLARWDQHTVKQTVVHAYAGWLGRLRPTINALRGLHRLPYLPSPGTELRASFASHLALRENDPALFAALLRAVYDDARAHGDHYFLLGLAAMSPLAAVLAPYAKLPYASRLYLAGWEDGLAAMAGVDRQQLAAPEIAVL